jgi:hypothetical protein
MEDKLSSSQDLDWARLLFSSRGGGSSTSNLSVNAGGMGVWSAVTACLITLFACVPTMGILTVLVIDQGRKIERLEDYIQAVYRIAPELQKKLEAEQAAKEN